MRETCRSEEHTSELQSRGHLVCRLLLEKKKTETSADLILKKAHARLAEVERDINEMMLFFFFIDTATTEIYTLSLHDALPISIAPANRRRRRDDRANECREHRHSR